MTRGRVDCSVSGSRGCMEAFGARMKSYLLICFALYVLPIRSQFVPFCNRSEFVLKQGEPLLPTLPNQFFYTVRADIVEWNATFYLSEYFDDPGNRGRIETDAFGGQMTVIADYDLNEAFVFDDASGECTVNTLLTQPTPNAFSATFLLGIVQGPNDTLHLGSPSTFLGFNNESVNYLGGGHIVNGVPCVRWQTCTVSESNSSSFLIDYYFSDPASGWTASGYSEPTPVLVVLVGENYNSTTDETDAVEHYYTYMPFQVGPSAVPDDVFQIPTGTACRGRIAGPALPPFPTYFSATSEYVDDTYSFVSKLYFDYTYQLVRIDYLDSTGPMTAIQDFNIDVVYSIARDYQNCSIYPLEYNDYTAFDTFLGSDGDAQLVTAQQLFLASNEFEYSYQGVANVRGAPVDSWISLRDFEAISPSSNLTNVIYQIFFTRPGFTLTSDFSTTTDPALWQLRLQATANYIDSVTGQPNATNFTAEFNIFGYTPDEPDLDVYDSSLCLNSSDFVTLNFAIVSNDTLRISSIRPAVRAALNNYVQTIEMSFVTPAQISAIQLFTGNGSYNVSVHISNLTDVTSSVWAYTAEGVVNAIVGDLSAGDPCPFNVTIGGKSYTTQFISVGELSSCEDCPSTLSVGETVGLAIAMFIAGWMFSVIFCIVLFVLWTHRQKTGTDGDTKFSATAVAYTKQEEEESEGDGRELVETDAAD